MLVLSRPAPKPISVPQKPENKDRRSSVSSTSPPDQPQADSRSDSISLRPQGRTGPGFVGREENPGPELAKGGPGSFKVKPEFRGHRSGQVQDPGHYGLVTVDGRPKSGGGYEPITRDRELADLNRPGSTGTRPSSSV
ncbi:UNVERIFIED_CONTAM: hypothetical protein Sradi_5272200 [Sesamum radiatum]|uniref:Uncharacterized protein n=1 Tax=Sesamum radiatum TaxID=300843 RepID=A0AAW2LMY0_SESRA